MVHIMAQYHFPELKYTFYTSCYIPHSVNESINAGKAVQSGEFYFFNYFFGLHIGLEAEAL